ncbi:MAG TPA: CHRD domain-containing protein [Stellaceae bacterium]|nr:CHRD domain-containing protein [Stellaceae bacterium]
MSRVISRRTAMIVAGVTAAAWAAGLALAAPTSFKVPLSGAQQVPPVQTPGTGTADLTYDPTTRVVTWSITFSGLSTPVTMAHFHGPAAEGKNGPVVIWLTKQGSPVESPIKGEATLTPEQVQQFSAGEWYINVHTRDHPAGEIRGQVMPPKG